MEKVAHLMAAKKPKKKKKKTGRDQCPTILFKGMSSMSLKPLKSPYL
jgi:hypothetical protein